jgi:hypothetical protein
MRCAWNSSGALLAGAHTTYELDQIRARVQPASFTIIRANGKPPGSSCNVGAAATLCPRAG